MPIQSTGQAGQGSTVFQPAATQQEGSHNLRKVQARHSEPNRVSGFQNPEGPSDTSILSRKAERVKISNKGVISTVSKVAAPLVEKGMTFSSQRHLKKIKSEHSGLQKELSGINKKTASLERDILKLEKKLEKVRTDKRDMSPARMQEYSEMQAKVASKKEQLDGLRVKKPQVEQGLASMKEALGKAEMEADLQQEYAESLRSGITAGSKLLGGLRKVYQETRDHGSAGRDFELDLGDLKMSANGHTELSAKDMKVVISDFAKNSDGSLTLALDECSASDVVIGDKPLGSVKLSGVRLTVNPPLSEQISEMMTCGFHKLPGKMMALSKEYEEKLMNEAGSLDRTVEVLGVKEMGVSSMEVNGEVMNPDGEGAENLMKLLESFLPGYLPGSEA
ncbi:hypothetical protein [Endozoicomonas arenosclerae]|uniref:hypothetical protein n=1 Tax=Endozoicomonas arenosclerae TaxID=1633495 RepID=UPI00078506CC|nr:hypothetical protein [Endozoicomonas arenosclerae]